MSVIGCRPEEIVGTTSDNRPVYIRYSGGVLSVECGEVGGNQQSPKRMLLEAQIGPPDDDDIEPWQVCDLAGITVRGMPLPGSKSPFIPNWSGDTTYWTRHICVTERGSMQFLSRLQAQIGEAAIFENRWIYSKDGRATRPGMNRRASLQDCRDGALLGFYPRAAPSREALAKPLHIVADLRKLYAAVVVLNFSWSKPRTHYTYPEVLAARKPPVDLHYGDLSGFMFTEFETKNQLEKELVEEIVQAADATFSNTVIKVQLATGLISPASERWFWYSNDMRDIFRDDPDCAFIPTARSPDLCPTARVLQTAMC